MTASRNDYEAIFKDWLDSLDNKEPQACLTILGQMTAEYTEEKGWLIQWGGWYRVMGIDEKDPYVTLVGEFNV